MRNNSGPVTKGGGGRSFTLFVCSNLVNGNIVNLQFVFPDKPLLCELRARVVNAFRVEEQSLIDRNQSIGYDVHVMFVFDSFHQRWRAMDSSDIIDGAQIFAQPRLSTSIVRSLCDVHDAVDMQKIPPPRRAAFNGLNSGSVENTSLVGELLNTSVRRDLRKQECDELVVMSSDDENENDDDYYSQESRRRGGDGKSSADLALAEVWDEAVRTLFRGLDDDRDGLVNVPDIPITLERLAAGTMLAVDSFRPQTFPRGGLGPEHEGATLLCDEPAFVAFCSEPENAGVVSGLLAFVHTIERTKQQQQQQQKAFSSPTSHQQQQQQQLFSTPPKNVSYF